MSRRHPARFLAGLVLEVAAVLIGVSLLPKLAFNRQATDVSQAQFADQRPSLVELATGPSVVLDQRPTILETPNPKSSLDAFLTENPATQNPAYVEHRLDEAGQQLLHGVSSYLSRTASELLQPGQTTPPAPPGSFSPPANPYRY
jgi:hypothetical protein